MRRLILLRPFVFLWLISMASGVYAFESSLWPGEGVPRFAAKADPLILHQKPASASPKLAPYSVTAGAEIRYDQSRLLALTPGHIKAKVAGALYGRSFGPITHLSEARYDTLSDDWKEWPYRAGDQFEHLQDRAEGACLVRRQRDVLELEWCPWQDSREAAKFEISGPPEIQWWIRVVTAAQQPVGWLLVDKKVIDVLSRRL